MPALIKASAVSPIDLTVAGIRVHVNRRGQDDGGVLHDEEDLADIRELCNKLSLDDELHEEALDVHKHYLGKSSGRHLLRTIIEMKERHRQDFESNSDVATPTDTETESDYETDSTSKAGKAPQKIPFLGSRRPVYWKILPWEMTLFRSRPTGQSPEFPEPDLLNALVGYYFKHINIELPLLHRPTFEKEIAQGLHKQNATFGGVVLLVCAMGSRYSSDPRVQLSETDLFPDADGRPSDGDGANSVADEEMRRRRAPPLLPIREDGSTSIKHGSFKNPSLFSRHRPFTISTFIVKRSPKDAPVDKDLLKLDELWKRAFWVLITIDRLLSSATGRPCALHDEDFDLELPIECDDEYWDDPDPELRLKQPEGKPSLITAFTLSIRFNQILDISMRTIYSIDKSKVLMGMLYEWEHRVVSEIDSALNKWLDTIPPHLRWGTEQPNEDFFLQSAILHSTYYYLQILVHRPFIPLPKKPSTSSFPSLTICTNAARKIIQIGLAVAERVDVVPSYTPLHLLSAAVILLLRIWESQKTETLTEQQYKKDMEGVNSCLKILTVAEKMSLSCGRLWDILYNLVMVNEMYVLPNLVKRAIQKSKKGKADPARTRTRQESSKMTTSLSPPPIYPPSPFADPSVPLALDPETGLLLAGFRSGPQHLGSDGAHSTTAGSGSSSSTPSSFNGFSSAVPPVNVTTADPDTQVVPSTSLGAPIRPGTSAPEWSAFAVPPETPQQSYLSSPFLEGFDSRGLRPSDRPGGSSPSPGAAAGLFDDGPQSRGFVAGLQPQQQGGSDVSGSLVFPMFGQDGNWNFAPMTEDVDMSNGLYSSIWAESVNVNTAP
ncbi:hypothetical protein H1R20_g482, partial [Candolleomyces eurysporus]